MAHIHILGICGTFMGGLARIAVALGHQVSGSDANTYPPMSTQLEELGVKLYEGYFGENLQPDPDLVIIGNAMSRGNAAVEYVLNKGLRYCSGPQWLSDQVLQDKWVLAVSGTHGKTTTSSLLAWILAYHGYEPGYLIGGVTANFEHSAHLGNSPFFVIEADEYDSAFFDKRSKMIHYRPKTLIINNLEYDHADIFPDLKAIQTQFHHCVRTVPALGQVIYPTHNQNVQAVIDRGCWSEMQTLGKDADWGWRINTQDGAEFEVLDSKRQILAKVKWSLIGEHNVANAVAAIAAAKHVGVLPELAAEALAHFKGIKRRMELKGIVNQITIYDDFAHHPTAIATTLAGLRNKMALNKINSSRIIAVLDPRSNTMKMGVHKDTLVQSLETADKIWLHKPQDIQWEIQPSTKLNIALSVEQIIDELLQELQSGDQVLIMSNGGFGGIHDKLLQALEVKYG